MAELRGQAEMISWDLILDYLYSCMYHTDLCIVVATSQENDSSSEVNISVHI